MHMGDFGPKNNKINNLNFDKCRRTNKFFWEKVDFISIKLESTGFITWF